MVIVYGKFALDKSAAKVTKYCGPERGLQHLKEIEETAEEFNLDTHRCADGNNVFTSEIPEGNRWEGYILKRLFCYQPPSKKADPNPAEIDAQHRIAEAERKIRELEKKHLEACNRKQK